VIASSVSCQLFHGPGSQEQAYLIAKTFGKVLPFDGGALKKEGCRELVDLLSQTPVGDGSHSVVVGPVDEAAAASTDVLLKAIEELKLVYPVLWAWDLGGVSSTLTSRCLTHFAPGVDIRWEGMIPIARMVLKAYLEGDWVSLIEEVKDIKEQDMLLRALVDVLQPKLESSTDPTPYLALWGHLRPLFSGGTLTQARILSAFLEAK